MESLGSCGTTLLVALLVGCGNSTSGGRSGDVGASCTIPAGTYTQRFSSESDGATCPPLPDQTLSLNANITLSQFGGMSSAPGAQGCTSDVDTGTCTMTQSCDLSTSGFGNQFTLVLTFEGGSASGSQTMVLTNLATNEVISNCTYEIAMTRN